MIRFDTAVAISFLAGQQSKDGSFIGWAGTSVDNFKPERRHETTFFTSLMLSCLQNVDDTERLRKRAADFLLQERSEQWSWNYWQRGSDLAQTLPYPDDLDDTSCALMALTGFGSQLVDGHALASLAKLLIATEVKPGGPYRTWLVASDLRKQWGDVDIAVNANIGSLLALHNVQIPGLNHFVDTAIGEERLTSPYYVGRLPILYFLARWYRGKRYVELRRLVSQVLTRPAELNALMLALCISAGCQLDVAPSKLSAAVKRLLSLQAHDHWPAEALYVDPQIKGVPYYAGSAALTTAFALEALSHYHAASAMELSQHMSSLANNTLQEALAESQLVSCTNLRRHYHAAIRRIARYDKNQQISDMATLTATAYGKPVRADTLKHLNLASFNGWIAYSLYDDFLDDESKVEQLGAANLALRQTLRHFHAALPDNQAFQRLVDETLNTVDAANTWEVEHARGHLTKRRLDYTLPNYKSYRQLAERSWGHMLAASGVLVALGYGADSQEFRQLQRFFRHFLIARQLNDDAHDWETDLARGHLSAVVSLLLSDFQPHESIDFKAQRSALRQHFWQVTIEDVATIITRQLKAAERALESCGMQDQQSFAAWLDALAATTQSAANASQETQKFIHSFERPASKVTLPK